MDNNLIIVDEYVQSVGESCRKQGTDILDNTIFTDYISVLNAIRASGIKSGEITDALDSYIECAEMMKDKLATISENMKTICDSFVEEVDGIDQYTF